MSLSSEYKSQLSTGSNIADKLFGLSFELLMGKIEAFEGKHSLEVLHQLHSSFNI